MWDGGAPNENLNENLKVPMLLCSLYIVSSKGVHEAIFGVGKHEFKILKVSQKHMAVRFFGVHRVLLDPYIGFWVLGFRGLKAWESTLMDLGTLG